MASLMVHCLLLGCVYTEMFSPKFVSGRYHLTFSRVYMETLPNQHGNVRSVTNRSATNKMATRRGKQQESFDVLARIRFSNAIITYHSHRNVRSVTYRSATKKMTNRRGKQQDSFQWSEYKVQLLLTVTYECKVKHSGECTDWEKVKTKYTDILALFREQLPSGTEEASQLE